MPALALGVFALTLADVASGFAFLPVAASAGVALLCLLLFVPTVRTGGFEARLFGLALLVSSVLAIAVRLGGYETVLGRPAEEWDAVRRRTAERVAGEVSDRFARLSRRALLEATQLASSSAVANALAEESPRRGLDAVFLELERAPLPRALPEAAPGATLYDRWGVPIAWGGESIDLSPSLRTAPPGGEERAFILEQGVFTYLVAQHSLEKGRGTLTVEIPLAARRRLNNRYLTDYEALSTWAGKSLSVDYLDVREEPPEDLRRFDDGNDRYWSTGERPALSFPLRSPSGEILAVATLGSESISTAVLERAREARELAGVFLALAALLAAGALGWRVARVQAEHRRCGLGRSLGFVAAVWGARLVLGLVDFPLGAGADLDNPAHYASDLFHDFFRSPADFLVTAFAALLSAFVLTLPWLRSEASAGPPGSLRTSYLTRGVVTAAVFGLLILVSGLVQDTWSNSHLPLAQPGLLPPEPARLAIQVGWIFVFAAAALAGTVLLGRFELPGSRRGSAFGNELGRRAAFDLAVFAGFLGLAELAGGQATARVLTALPALLGLEALAVLAPELRRRFTTGPAAWRVYPALLLFGVAGLSFYPAIAHFEERMIRGFVQGTVAPAVRHQGDSQFHVLQQTLAAIDDMDIAALLDTPQKADLAYRIWSGSDLSVSALSSSIEIRDPEGDLVSRFALSFPDVEADWREPSPAATKDWLLETESYPGEPHRRRVFHAHRSFVAGDERLWSVEVRLAADWSNLMFLSTGNPYVELFRSGGSQPSLPLPHRELGLFVYDASGKPIFASSSPPPGLGPEELETAAAAPRWLRAGQERVDNVFLFADESYRYALSYPAKTWIDYASEITGWALLTALVGAALFLLVLLIAMAQGALGFRFTELWAEAGTSFYGKLFVSFVSVALIPITLLSFVVSGILVQRLEGDVEQEGLSRARVVERLVREYLLYERMNPEQRGVAAVTDSVLKWVGGLVEAEVDLYSRGELVATSKRELFASGLLSPRAVPAVYRELVLDRTGRSIHRESVGAFEYVVVSVPVTLEPWGEPGILSIPLASREREIDRQVAALNQTVLFVALLFAALAAALAYTVARRIAEPIKVLTAATRRVAQGDLQVSLPPGPRDEIGVLFGSFEQMTADLQQQRVELERTKKLEAWAEMARQVAHEIKNPLTPIQLAAEHLRRVFGDPRVDFGRVLRDCTETILQQVRALRQISMEFSTFASPAPLSPELTDFGRLVRQTIEPYAKAPPPGVRVELDLPPELPPILLDRRLIQRTLLNLVENAFHALNGGGRVRVASRVVEDEGDWFIELTVSDDGVGLDPELRERIFEPYFSTRAAGTGLGLAIARKAVEEHGGTIRLESEAGRGTEVVLRLPARSAPEPTAVAENEKDEVSPGR